MLFCIPGILGADDLSVARDLFETVAGTDGRATAGYRAREVKNNLQLAPNPDTQPVYDRIRNAILDNATFRSVAIPRYVRTPLLSEYSAGMEYGYHTDAAHMGKTSPIRTDLSMTLFLSDPDAYEGGDLVIRSAMGETAIKLDAGDAVVYPTVFLHRVNRVESGVRRVAVTWIQSWVRSAEQRQILHDLERCKLLANGRASQAEDTQLLYMTHANLLRMWSEG
jgi:PKHD-type hydroxylase